VTLDPDTAHARLVLSEDHSFVRWEHARQDLPKTLERFTAWSCVLGQQKFRDGRHYWKVEMVVEEGEDDSWWAVGVAKESVKRTEFVKFSPENGIWGVQRVSGEFVALTSPHTPLSPVPRTIWVYLDYPLGLVTFINADTGDEIFTFQRA
ncbi:BT1A1 protein, partial [Eurystomus gularis]|nr:BT1A1 protein [Eurystomus gularis]